MKKIRQRILNKTNGRCAYCGGDLSGKQWHIDHIDPLHRGNKDIGNYDFESNKMAACVRCNLWKKTFSLNDFRNEISKQAERLYRDSAPFKLAIDFGVVTIPPKLEVVFYFERSLRLLKSGQKTGNYKGYFQQIRVLK